MTAMDLYAPSQKQIDFAYAISEALNVPLPTVFTKGAYQAFTANNKVKYYDEIAYWKELNEESDLWEYDLAWHEP